MFIRSGNNIIFLFADKGLHFLSICQIRFFFSGRGDCVVAFFFWAIADLKMLAENKRTAKK